MKYHLVLFDIDGTLLNFIKSESAALRRVCEAAGMPLQDADVLLYSRINDSYWKKLEQGKVTREELLVCRFKDFLTEMDRMDLSAEELNQAYLNTLGTDLFEEDGAVELLKTLQPIVPMGYVTNGNPQVQHRKYQSSFLKEFVPKEHLFISEEIGATKPDPVFFSRVMEHFPGISSKEVLVVGDSLTADIQGGIAAGMDTCWYHPGDEMATQVQPTWEVRHLRDIVAIVTEHQR